MVFALSDSPSSVKNWFLFERERSILFTVMNTIIFINNMINSFFGENSVCEVGGRGQAPVTQERGGQGGQPRGRVKTSLPPEHLGAPES